VLRRTFQRTSSLEVNEWRTSRWESRKRGRLLRDSPVQSLACLYASGLFADGCVHPRTEIPEGRPKHEQWYQNPLEPNPVVHHESIEYKAAAGDAVGEIQGIAHPDGFQWFVNISILILHWGDRGGNIPRSRPAEELKMALIHKAGARDLSETACNETQWTRKDDSRTRFKKQIIPLASGFHSPLHGGVPPHAAGSPSTAQFHLSSLWQHRRRR
jgi:hypothetical protein